MTINNKWKSDTARQMPNVHAVLCESGDQWRSNDPLHQIARITLFCTLSNGGQTFLVILASARLENYFNLISKMSDYEQTFFERAADRKGGNLILMDALLITPIKMRKRSSQVFVGVPQVPLSLLTREYIHTCWSNNIYCSPRTWLKCWSGTSW